MTGNWDHLDIQSRMNMEAMEYDYARETHDNNVALRQAGRDDAEKGFEMMWAITVFLFGSSWNIAKWFWGTTTCILLRDHIIVNATNAISGPREDIVDAEVIYEDAELISTPPLEGKSKYSKWRD